MWTGERCEICGWPTVTCPELGCVPGNCSYRPDDPAEQRRMQKRREELAAAREASTVRYFSWWRAAVVMSVQAAASLTVSTVFEPGFWLNIAGNLVAGVVVGATTWRWVYRSGEGSR